MLRKRKKISLRNKPSTKSIINRIHQEFSNTKARNKLSVRYSLWKFAWLSTIRLSTRVGTIIDWSTKGAWVILSQALSEENFRLTVLFCFFTDATIGWDAIMYLSFHKTQTLNIFNIVFLRVFFLPYNQINLLTLRRRFSF